MRSRRPQRKPSRKRLWTRVRRLLGLGHGEPPPPDWSDEEPALVPVGPPRRPRPSSAIALELPEEREDVDARGREAG
jgi:hypothetical protein